MADIFGFEKQSQPSSVLSFQDILLQRDGGNGSKTISLVQSAQLDYTRTIQPIMGVGTSVVYLAPQPGTGTLRITRAITADGSMSTDLKSNDACNVETIKLTSQQSGCKNKSSADVTAQGMMSGYQYSINVGAGVSVTDGMTFTIINVDTNGKAAQKQQQQAAANTQQQAAANQQ